MATVAAGASSGAVAPGLIAFLIVVALGVALWLLLRSMNKHLGRVQPDDDASDDVVPTVTANDEEKGAGHKISP
jgi:hypothetical protein